MNSNTLIVQDYISSLKEDKELDYIFPILLNVMGYRVVQTAKEAKGQSQYGKDIIAIGKDSNGVKWRWYFEIKGYKDRDITEGNYSIQDGVRESIVEAKDAAFNDSSISEFNTLPIKIVFVHNGTIKPNIRQTFDGFISKLFQNETGKCEFERWDIYYLTNLFSTYLFNEYLLTDGDSNRLLKRVLAFLDTPGNDFEDLAKLMDIQLSKSDKIGERPLKKLFATIKLLMLLIFHYSKENNNLLPAKECSSLIILKTWAWILRKKIYTKKSIINEFTKLLDIQFLILEAYFKKTFPIASIENGLFSENGAFFESVGYPLRCFDYIGDLIYYCELRTALPSLTKSSNNSVKIKNKQKDLIIKLVSNNSGFERPLIDNHSIPIMLLLTFFLDKKCLRQVDIKFVQSYIVDIVENLIIIKRKTQRFPELYNRINLLIEYSSIGERPEDYTDESSILIAILFELIAFLNGKPMYDLLKNELHPNMSLQIAHPLFEKFPIENLLFEKHMNQEYYVECYDDLPEDFEEFKKAVKNKKHDTLSYITDNLGFPFLRILAHTYFKNEIFPNEWRHFFETNK